jgi:hypothetical protein
MKVHELIDLLQTQPQQLEVVYKFCSDYRILEAEEITVEDFCVERADGYVQYTRPDKPNKKYLVLPGN